MKRLFSNALTQEEATVTQETAAVTVTRRDIGSRSKGRPVRIPLKLCQGESVEQEARRQEFKLQTEGFVFDRQEGDQPAPGAGPFLYVAIGKDQMPEAMDWATGANMPEGVFVSPLPDGVALRDERRSEIVLSTSRDANAVVPSDSPLAAAAYVLAARNLATVVYEKTSGPNDTELLTPWVRLSLAKSLPASAQAYLDEAGLCSPGVVKTSSLAPAVLL